MKLPTWFRGSGEFPAEGTVPYHQRLARRWRLLSWYSLIVGAVFLLLSATAATEKFWLIVVFDGVVLFAAGTNFQRDRSRFDHHRMMAWKAETQPLLEAMSASGMYGMVDAIEALRDGPPPPGIRKKKWVQGHQEALDKIRAGDFGPDGTIEVGD